MAFQYAWFVDPFVTGDYPKEMRQYVVGGGGDRLPKFTKQQRKELLSTQTTTTTTTRQNNNGHSDEIPYLLDFMGVNHYSTMYASKPKTKSMQGGYWMDMFVDVSTDPSWRKNFMGWSTNPDGCRELLLWISRRYPGIPIVMTEHGTAEDDDTTLETAVQQQQQPQKQEDEVDDMGRVEYFKHYLTACGEAIGFGANLQGYFALSLLDNFEWEYGYTKRFGFVLRRLQRSCEFKTNSEIVCKIVQTNY
mmetsp:Transcript_26441/g.30076  ORF Transcript_26441/g.30076 Transcript_26441/m.30076 type:complete len:248 (-) Transcript_26441:15-758(-)